MQSERLRVGGSSASTIACLESTGLFYGIDSTDFAEGGHELSWLLYRRTFSHQSRWSRNQRTVLSRPCSSVKRAPTPTHCVFVTDQSRSGGRALVGLSLGLSGVNAVRAEGANCPFTRRLLPPPACCFSLRYRPRSNCYQLSLVWLPAPVHPRDLLYEANLVRLDHPRIEDRLPCCCLENRYRN